jgi:hypothetical protein
VDALVHRSQLWVLQQSLDKAQADLEEAVKMFPSHVLA